MKRARIFGLLGIGVVLTACIAFLIPTRLSCGCGSRLDACQENLVKLDGAVQQYTLDHDFETAAQAVEWINANGGLSVLVGEDQYLRVTPFCPGGGTYALVPGGHANVKCSIAAHVYPGGS